MSSSKKSSNFFGTCSKKPYTREVQGFSTWLTLSAAARDVDIDLLQSAAGATMLSIGTSKSNLVSYFTHAGLGEAAIFPWFKAVLPVTVKIKRQFGALLQPRSVTGEQS
jgi:hypothetical protein